MGEKLTKKDIEKIEEEIKHRKLVLRKDLIAAVKEARSHGDLSENFEYYAAKREKNINESRIRYLDKMLRFSEVIEDESGMDEAGLNKLVELYFENDEEEMTIKLVTPIRGASLEGRISIESPLGKALIGKKAGDRVKVVISDKVSYYVQIKSVVLDDEDDEIRKF